jgi:transcriptional regulator with XRE-family HTH domain
MRRAFRIRLHSGLNQDRIADRLNCDKSLVSRRLNGEENLTLKSMSSLASAMDCRLVINFKPFEECGEGNNYFSRDPLPVLSAPQGNSYGDPYAKLVRR